GEGARGGGGRGLAVFCGLLGCGLGWREPALDRTGGNAAIAVEGERDDAIAVVRVGHGGRVGPFEAALLAETLLVVEGERADAQGFFRTAAHGRAPDLEPGEVVHPAAAAVRDATPPGERDPRRRLALSGGCPRRSTTEPRATS